jgi:hypothetical protein
MTLEPTLIGEDGKPVMTSELVMLNIVLMHQKARMTAPFASLDICPRLNDDWTSNWKPSGARRFCCAEGTTRWLRYEAAQQEGRERRRR